MEIKKDGQNAQQSSYKTDSYKLLLDEDEEGDEETIEVKDGDQGGEELIKEFEESDTSGYGQMLKQAKATYEKEFEKDNLSKILGPNKEIGEMYDVEY